METDILQWHLDNGLLHDDLTLDGWHNELTNLCQVCDAFVELHNNHCIDEKSAIEMFEQHLNKRVNGKESKEDDEEENDD